MTAIVADPQDIAQLTELNAQFIDAFRIGSWDRLRPVLSPAFSYIDGDTGEVWSEPRYIDDIEGKPMPTIGIDQLAIHVDGDVAVVSARTFTQRGRYNRYVDTYERRPEGWRCVHACVWPLQPPS
jgi:hypothetical protein